MKGLKGDRDGDIGVAIRVTVVQLWAFALLTRVKSLKSHMDGAPGGRDLGSCSHFCAVVFLSCVKSTNSDNGMAHGGGDLCRRENIEGVNSIHCLVFCK